MEQRERRIVHQTESEQNKKRYRSTVQASDSTSPCMNRSRKKLIGYYCLAISCALTLASYYYLSSTIRSAAPEFTAVTIFATLLSMPPAIVMASLAAEHYRRLGYSLTVRGTLLGAVSGAIYTVVTLVVLHQEWVNSENVSFGLEFPASLTLITLLIGTISGAVLGGYAATIGCFTIIGCIIFGGIIGSFSPGVTGIVLSSGGSFLGSSGSFSFLLFIKALFSERESVNKHPKKKVKLQKFLNMFTRLTSCMTLAVGSGISFVAVNHHSYWHKTIFRVQTVDFNLLSHTLPTKLSYALQQDRMDEVQRTLDSNYALFGLVVTDADGNEVLAASGDPSDFRSWDSVLEDPQALLEHPYDLLYNPPPLSPQSLYDSPYALEPQTTPVNNQGEVIGRVYYVRGVPPHFWRDFWGWVQKPFGSSSRYNQYRLAMFVCLTGGFSRGCCSNSGTTLA